MSVTVSRGPVHGKRQAGDATVSAFFDAAQADAFDASL